MKTKPTQQTKTDSTEQTAEYGIVLNGYRIGYIEATLSELEEYYKLGFKKDPDTHLLYLYQ